MTTTAQEAGGHAAAREILEAKERITAPTVRPLTPWMLLVGVMAERDRLRELLDQERAAHALIADQNRRYDSWRIDALNERDAMREERDEAWAAHRDAQSACEMVAAERGRLVERRDALLKPVRDLSQSTPLASDLEGWEGQRAALIAEVGTLLSALEEHATIAESACRMLGRVRDRLQSADGVDETALYLIRWDTAAFLSSPGHEVPGLRAQVAARDRAIDALIARVRKLLAWQAETELALEGFRDALTAADEEHDRMRAEIEQHPAATAVAIERAIADHERDLATSEPYAVRRWAALQATLRRVAHLYHLAHFAGEVARVAEDPRAALVRTTLTGIVEAMRELADRDEDPALLSMERAAARGMTVQEWIEDGQALTESETTE